MMATNSEVDPMPSVEYLLNQAARAHRNAIKHLRAENTRLKEKHDRLLAINSSIMEKGKVMQKDCADLKQENRHLTELVDTLGTKHATAEGNHGNGCRSCRYLEQSMEALTEAYTKTIQTKDGTINMLEQRLVELPKQNLGKDKTSETRVHGPKSTERTSSECPLSSMARKATSPDTTSGQSVTRSASSPDMEEEISPSRRAALRLAKDKQKRSRYQEASLHVSNNTRHQTSLGDSGCEKSFDASKTVCAKKASSSARAGSSHKKVMPSPNIVVPESFMPEDAATINMRLKKFGKRSRGSDGNDTNVSDSSFTEMLRNCKVPKMDRAPFEIVVPETLAIDFADEVDGSLQLHDVNDVIQMERHTENGCRAESADENSTVHITQILAKGHGENVLIQSLDLSLGTPKASSTQAKKNSSKSGLVRHEVARDLILLNSPNCDNDLDDPVMPMRNSDKNRSLSQKTRATKIFLDKASQKKSSQGGKTLECTVTESERAKFPSQLSPVFIGSKANTAVGDIGSPSLFDDVATALNESHDDDPESPFLLRQPPSVKCSSAVETVDQDSQSPSLLQKKQISHSSSQSISNKPACVRQQGFNQSKSSSQGVSSKPTNPERPARSTRSNSQLDDTNIANGKTATRTSKSTRDLRQTTLTQTFDAPRKSKGSGLHFSPVNDVETAERSSLHEVQNIDTSVSSPHTSGKRQLRGRHQEEIIDISEGTENCEPRSVFKKPLSPDVQKMKSPPKRRSPESKGRQTSKLNQKGQTTQADFDDTLPLSTQSCVKGKSSLGKNRNSIMAKAGLFDDLDETLSPLCTQNVVEKNSRLSAFKRGNSWQCRTNQIMDLNETSCTGGTQTLTRMKLDTRDTCEEGKSIDWYSSAQDDMGIIPGGSVADQRLAFAAAQNRSLDPAVQLSQDYPDTDVHIRSPRAPTSCDLTVLEVDLIRKGKSNQGEILRGNHKSERDEESQGIPSSSRSITFGPSKNTPACKTARNISEDSDDDSEGFDHEMEAEQQRTPHVPERSINCSFDRVPRKESPGFAYVDVVRNRGERRKLHAYNCQECENFFKTMDLTDEEKAERMKECSRHRARYAPPSTPEHFWSIGFPDTPECEERGYIKKDTERAPSKFRRRKQLTRRFKTKAEEDDRDEEKPSMGDNYEGENEKHCKGDDCDDHNVSDLVFDL